MGPGDDKQPEYGAQIVAGTYELLERLGSGGSGVVYRGRHIRLDKTVVLKADKRTLTASSEELRREVDALKCLSHSYIPQVYDFVQENGVVYTVMGYIEGESLNKPLRRGERFSQPQVIEWACELLDALRYLHSRPPYGILHGDIKPSNIMLTKEGDVRLIDYNIALALGEEGAVRVGGSLGYASPEHYGVDFSSSGTSSSSGASGLMARRGRITDFSSENTGKKRHITLDVRSDIYSLGATLYHLLSGKRPPEREVPPLTNVPGVSPAVAAIIQKAMSPAPEQRYQSAEEMLYDFEHLHSKDPRLKRWKGWTAISAGILAAVFLTGGVCTFTGLRQQENVAVQQREEADKLRLEAEEAEKAEKNRRTALSHITDAEDAIRRGDAAEAVERAEKAMELDTSYSARAQKVLADALGVYDLSAVFKSTRVIDLPSGPQKVVLSPQGSRVAVAAGETMAVYDTRSGECVAEFAKPLSALADVVFLDEDRVLFAGKEGLMAYDAARGTELWHGEQATGISVSADGSVAAAVYRDESHATLYAADTGEILKTVNFQGLRQSVMADDILNDQGHNLFALNEDGSLLAVSFENGGLQILNQNDREEDVILFDSSDYVHFEGGFYKQFFAFAASTGDGTDSILVIVDMDALEQTVAYENTVPFHIQADASGIFIATGHTLVRMDTYTWEDHEVAYSDGASISSFWKGKDDTLVILEDGAVAVYDNFAEQIDRWEPETAPFYFAQSVGGWAVAAGNDTPELRVMQLENHEDTTVFSYDRTLVHSEARLSASGKTAMLFHYDGFYLFTMDGQLIRQVEFPNPDDVYDTLYWRDEGYLEVIYRNGLVRNYSTEDGSVLAERADEPPKKNLEEEFETADYRIVSPLHGTPKVYDKNGNLFQVLQAEDFLTYVTEVDNYIITEYITTDGKRYGLLLNRDLETLARLPDLCDITKDGTLIFDDMSGNLRKSQIYTADELLALAKSLSSS